MQPVRRVPACTCVQESLKEKLLPFTVWPGVDSRLLCAHLLGGGNVQDSECDSQCKFRVGIV